MSDLRQFVAMLVKADMIFSYGMHGKCIISRYIYNVTAYLEEQTGVSRAEYGSDKNYTDIVEKIFLADVVAVLISEDYSCQLDAGYTLAWFSEIYGAVEFPFREQCPVLAALQEEGVRAKRLLDPDDDEEGQGTHTPPTKQTDK